MSFEDWYEKTFPDINPQYDELLHVFANCWYKAHSEGYREACSDVVWGKDE